MEHSIGQIREKPHEYKICPRCLSFNWHKNQVCACGHKTFLTEPQEVQNKIDKELAFWTKYGRYSEKDVDTQILKEV